MIEADTIEQYLEWRQNKVNELRYSGDDAVSPQIWIDEILMSDARARIDAIKQLAEQELEPIEFANKVIEVLYIPLEELTNEKAESDTDL